MLSGKSMVWDAGCLVQVCEDPEKMAHHAKRGCGESAGTDVIPPPPPPSVKMQERARLMKIILLRLIVLVVVGVI
jgi:hypothetical protein